MKSTPWGVAQNETVLAPGIVSVSTASHGGIWLDKSHRDRLPHTKNFLGTDAWWEEDCDWAIPYYFFSGEICAHGTEHKFPENLAAATNIIKYYHPEFMTAMEG